MLNAEQLDEIRRIVRLEALRAAVFSTASESLDEHVPRLVVDIELSGEVLAASISYFDASGVMVGGGTL
jgi:hypothetical protein